MKTEMIQNAQSDGAKTYRTVTWVMAGLCLAIVLVVAGHVYREHREAQRRAPLMAHNVSAEEYYIQYPPGWEFLGKEPRHREKARFPVMVDREQFTADVARVAQEMEVSRVESAKRRRESPLLTLYRKRQDQEEAMRVGAGAPSAPITRTTGKLPLEPPALAPGEVIRTPEVRAMAGPNSVPTPMPTLDEVLSGEGGRTFESAPSSPRAAANLGNLQRRAGSPVGHLQHHAQTPYDYRRGRELLRKFHDHAERRMNQIGSEMRDYTCILYKWDQTNLPSRDMDVMELKVREKPYSIYARFISPGKTQGREWIYWDGRYEGKLMVNSGPKMFGRTLLLPLDSQAIRNSASHSVLELGFSRMLRMLAEISADEAKFETARVYYYDQARVGDRPCYALEVVFDEPREDVDFYKIQILVDRRLDIPIQLTLYDRVGPRQEVVVKESYTYVVTGVNVGLTDRDFSYLNPEYGFKRYVRGLSDAEVDFMERVGL